MINLKCVKFMKIKMVIMIEGKSFCIYIRKIIFQNFACCQISFHILARKKYQKYLSTAWFSFSLFIHINIKYKKWQQREKGASSHEKSSSLKKLHAQGDENSSENISEIIIQFVFNRWGVKTWKEKEPCVHMEHGYIVKTHKPK